MTDDPAAELRRPLAEQAVALSDSFSRAEAFLAEVPDIPVSLTAELLAAYQHIEAIKALAAAEVVAQGGTVDEAAAAAAGITPPEPQPQENPDDGSA